MNEEYRINQGICDFYNTSQCPYEIPCEQGKGKFNLDTMHQRECDKYLISNKESQK